MNKEKVITKKEDTIKKECVEGKMVESTTTQEIDTADPEKVDAPITHYTTMWNNDTLMKTAFKAAKFLSTTDLVPSTYKNEPANCLVALDLANRTGHSPMMIMQNLYIVHGKPAWSGQFAIALVNTGTKFEPIKYVYVGEKGKDSYGCYATAIRKEDGVKVVGTTITIEMAKKEGWYGKKGSKWQTMPEQMLLYRAGAFFARAHCPELLFGLQTAEEIRDVDGYNQPKETVKISIESDKAIEGEVE